MLMHSNRQHIAALLAVSGMLVTGCSAPTVMFDTPTGPTTIYSPSPSPSMPGGLVGPPPGLDAQLAAATPTVANPAIDRSGTYAGNAVPLDTGGGTCLQDQPVSDFRVRGNSVHFGGYRGTIAPDGSLQMVYGQTWIIGRFEGATFHGQVDMNSGFGNPMCTFMMSLQRVGP